MVSEHLTGCFWNRFASILCRDRESKTAKAAAPIKSISLSVPKPHKKEETLNLSKVSWFLFNSFYICRLQKQLFFLPYKSLYFERYAAVHADAWATWSCDVTDDFKYWLTLLNICGSKSNRVENSRSIFYYKGNANERKSTDWVQPSSWQNFTKPGNLAPRRDWGTVCKEGRLFSQANPNLAAESSDYRGESHYLFCLQDQSCTWFSWKQIHKILSYHTITRRVIIVFR